MIPIKNSYEVEQMRRACRIAAGVLDRVVNLVVPGVNTYDLDQAGKRYIRESGATSACHNFQNGNRIYPGYICVSVNDEVVHGIGSLRRTIRSGDVVSVDVVISYNGFIGDNARTVMVGEVSSEVRHLVETTRNALGYAISFARDGGRVGGYIPRRADLRGIPRALYRAGICRSWGGQVHARSPSNSQSRQKGQRRPFKGWNDPGYRTHGKLG